MHRPILIAGRGHTLWAVEHIPERGEQVPVVIICPGVTGTKVGPHRMLRSISLVLEEIGVASIRFDFFGSGESDGEFSEVTFSSQVQDVLTVLEHARSDPRIRADQVGLLGLSMGGLVAAVAAGQRADDIRKLALLAPLVVLPAIARRILASRTNSRLDVFDYHGNRFGIRFGEDIVQLDLMRMAGAFAGDLLIVQGNGKGEVSWHDVAAFRRDVYDGRGILQTIEGANHTFDGGLWEAQVLECLRAFWQSGQP